MSIKKILIADDEPIMRNFLKEFLIRKKYEVKTAENGEIALNLLQKEHFDLLLTDMKMPKKTGLEVLKEAKQIDPSLFVIIMTAYGTIDNAVSAMKLGAFNYLIKPFSPESLEILIESICRQKNILKENHYLKEKTKKSCIVASPTMKTFYEDAEKIAKTSASVFITGESGTGKEIAAEFIHHHSLRSSEPFIKINCAAICDSLAESEFFGHEKGAFTGADKKKEGKFEIANKGTLMLDEITEIPLNLQPKLLRAIQEKEFERVGGLYPIKTDIRFIATSNRNMEEAIRTKIFREDLFFRLNVIPLQIPPLRERKEDILALAEFFIEKFCIENHKKKKKISSSAKEKLLSYFWPGNVRELANIIERTIVLDFSETIEKEHLQLDFFQKSQSSNTLKEIEKEAIIKTLEKAKNNKEKTAQILGISKKTLYNKLKSYLI